jgi:malate dehydrogenase (oxaloacetate-decarboxylating)(NADP+)
VALKKAKRSRKTAKRSRKKTTGRMKKAAKSVKKAVRRGARKAKELQKTTSRKVKRAAKKAKKTARRRVKKATSSAKKSARTGAKRVATATAAATTKATRELKKRAEARRQATEGRVKAGLPTGIALLHDARINKGTAFTEEERDAFKLRGLLPPVVNTIEEQQERVLENYKHKPTPLEKYIFMIALQDRNETLFYRTVIDNIYDMMPIIYTPTVGEACAKFGHIFRQPRGLYISAKHKGQIARVLRNWPEKDVGVIVVTDGERILGLGDLGAHGMGIPIGKLSLYTACAGVHPRLTLPVTLDVGTDNEELLEDELYIGIRQKRLRGAEYDELVEEFISAVKRLFPDTLVQFEDFATRNAFRLLHHYRDKICTFNDDIQGTAAVTLAGLLGAGRITGQDITKQTLLFLGAGEAGIGIADLCVSAMVREGMSHEEAKSRMWFVDSKGLVVKSRKDLAEHKLPYARDHQFLPDLSAAIEAAQPTTIIGVSGRPQSFTESMVRRMAEINEQPIVFALSNPTSKAECTAEQAYEWTDGRGIFASGSPFDPVTYKGTRHVPTQGNNAYIFPGLGLGAVISRAKHVTDDMFYVATRAAADMTTDEELQQGSILPPLEAIREVSATIAAAVAEYAWDEGLARRRRPRDIMALVRSQMYDPQYSSYV